MTVERRDPHASATRDSSAAAPGSGVYVREQASLPGPREAGSPAQRNGERSCSRWATSSASAGAGWLLLGIAQPETVAEHSFRAGVVGITLAAMAGADVGRTAALCLLHDAHETRIGDVPSVGRAYVSTAAPEAVSVH